MIIGFNLSKVNIERKEVSSKANIETKNNVKIEDVQERSLAPLTKERSLAFSFTFKVLYEPQFASLEMVGEVTYMTDEEQMKEILEEWKTNKKVKPSISINVMNYILTKCNIRALQFEQELNLPPHIPFPRVTVNEEAAEKKPKKQKK